MGVSWIFYKCILAYWIVYLFSKKLGFLVTWIFIKANYDNIIIRIQIYKRIESTFELVLCE